MSQCACGGPGTTHRSLFSFPVGPGNRTQVVGLGGKSFPR